MKQATLSGKAETIIIVPGLRDIAERIVSEAAAAGIPVELRGGSSPKRKTMKVLWKECLEECRKIMATENLTRKAKTEAIENNVECFVDDLISVDSRLPEVRAWQERDSALERKYYPKRGVTICCPYCGDFYPKRPPEVKSNDKEFDAIRGRKAAELVRKILAGKAA